MVQGDNLGSEFLQLVKTSGGRGGGTGRFLRFLEVTVDVEDEAEWDGRWLDSVVSDEAESGGGVMPAESFWFSIIEFKLALEDNFKVSLTLHSLFLSNGGRVNLGDLELRLLESGGLNKYAILSDFYRSL